MESLGDGNDQAYLSNGLLPPWVEPRHNAPRSLRSRALEQSVLLVTGARGSGKSRLLQELQRDPLIVAHFSGPSLAARPRSDLWRGISLKSVNVSYWEAAWRCIMSAAILSHLNEHRDVFDKDQRKRLEKAIRRLPKDIFHSKRAQHPFAIIRVLAHELIGQQDSIKLAHFETPQWEQAEQVARDLIRLAPPLLIEIDHLDDKFDSDPAILTEVQAGLASYVVNSERNPFPKDKFRLHVAIRHATHMFALIIAKIDYSLSPAFIEILWTKEALHELLNATLHADSQLDGIALSHLNNLFESTSISGKDDDATESVEDYIVRHSSLSPSDLSSIARRLRRRLDYLGKSMPSSEVKAQIHDVAVFLAESRINQMLSNIEAFGRRSTAPDMTGTGVSMDLKELSERFTSFVNSIGKERFKRTEILDMVQGWEAATRPYLLDAMWIDRILAIEVATSQLRIAGSIVSRPSTEQVHLAFNPILREVCDLVTPEGVVELGFA